MLTARVPSVGIGLLGVALAFGLTVVTGMYALGGISGGHFNPAITLGLATARRFPARDVLPYWAAQVAGAIIGATDVLAPPGFAGIAVGLALTLVHLVILPVTNASVNPARSTGPALFQGGWALGQLWLFWVAPLAGGLLAGFAYPLLRPAKAEEVPAAEPEERRSPPQAPLPTR